MSRLLALIAVVAALLARTTYAQGLFSQPAFGARGGHWRRPAQPYNLYDDFGYEDRRAALPPCPHYQPMRVSDWWEDGQRYTMRATLPGVDERHRRASLSRDGLALHVSAARPLPARGRECLPRGARVSADGRHEVFEATLPVPAGADLRAATVRQERRGLEVAVPRRATPQRPPAPAREQAAEPAAARARGAPAAQAAAARAAAPAARRTPKVLPQAPVAAPPPPGIEVVDEGLSSPPAKLPHAAEGWRDHRGEFHEY